MAFCPKLQFSGSLLILKKLNSDGFVKVFDYREMGSGKTSIYEA